MEAIKHEIKGIKCDAKGCDYVDESAKYEDYEKYLGAPCPKCGANLLTEEDLAACKAIMAVCGWVNKIAGPQKPGGQYGYFRVEMDGTGIPKLEFDRVEKAT